MREIKTIVVQPKKARPFFGFHPWLYESAIERTEGTPNVGEMVRVVTSDKEFIAFGLFNPHSKIRVRLYSWDKDCPLDEALVVARIERAVRFRLEHLGLGERQGACRLFYSESDGLSGLTIDRYADFVVVQITSHALLQFESAIVASIVRLIEPAGVYRRTDRAMNELEGMATVDGLLAGAEPPALVTYRENGVLFHVDIRHGQKTGAFLDQRENRLAACRYTQGRRVLDLFCHTGGFALAAKKRGGAVSVLGIDASGSAIALAQRNADANEVVGEFQMEDAFDAAERMAREKQKFGVVFCDPPKFARTATSVGRATKGYQQINRLALDLLEPDGILVTCSCSGHLDAAGFIETLVEASQRASRELHFLEIRGQAPDHPTSAYCLETAYLKCVIARAL